jgi:hypothetical protein
LAILFFTARQFRENFQIPPDLVVKTQVVDIAEIIYHKSATKRRPSAV